jgi:poly(hydroxyalkanoate) depolymerase family esterase
MMLMAIALAAGSWISDSYTNAAGTRTFQLYVPAGYTKAEKRPLLVHIHGCTETPGEFAGLTRIAQLADKQRLLVLLPGQSATANPSLCWNWFVPENQKRGAGEPSIIKGMIDRVESRYSVDRDRVYVAGVSSGGYMTSILLSCYADVFAAGMVASGGMYEAALDLNTAIPAALQGSARDPKVSGADAYRCSGSVHPRLVPVLVFHGGEDPYVNVRGGQQVVDAFVQMNDLGDDGEDNDSIVSLANGSDTASGGLAYTWNDYGFGSTTLIRHYVVTHMGHAWSGGDANYPYAEPRGPDETALMWSFFEKWRRGELRRVKRQFK